MTSRSFFHNHTDADLQAAIDEATPFEERMTPFERECLEEIRAEQARRFQKSKALGAE